MAEFDCDSDGRRAFSAGVADTLRRSAMAQSGRERHRDRDPGRRLDSEESPSAHRVFRMTDAQRQRVAKSLRYIDEARRALERQENPDHREIIRELRVSADQIFDVLGDLEEADSGS
jgi:hypothetical protein